VLAVVSGDPSAPDRDSVLTALTSEAYGLPADQAAGLLVTGGATEVAEVAARLADYAASGADRLVVSFAGGDWHRQCELLAEAAAGLA
jgi:hypothetical protein